MKGSFSEESLLHYTELVAHAQPADFSEDETYDFTRCVRSDGSYYGTSGRCRKGTETDPKEQAEPKSKKEKGVSPDMQIALMKHIGDRNLNAPEYEEFRTAIDKIADAIDKATWKVLHSNKPGEIGATEEEVQLKMGRLEEQLSKKAFEALWKGYCKDAGFGKQPKLNLRADTPHPGETYGFRTPMAVPAHEAMLRLGVEKHLGQLNLNKDLKEIAESEKNGWYRDGDDS